ncbi:hypothetical protein [Nostoc sp.]|uniref:hypothetical protein n=1 Tax=Nostoc sp. TaxID=1180 RepID=UPI002FF504D3
METHILKKVGFFSKAELESLELVPEELEAIEAELVPNLENISFEDVAKELEACFQENIEELRLEGRGSRRKKNPKNITTQQHKTQRKWPKVNFNINKNKLTKLLMNTINYSNKELGRKAKLLLNQMSKQNWQVLAGGHSGGLGGGGRPADPNPHITLRVGKTTYHLRYTFKHGQMLLTHITP